MEKVLWNTPAYTMDKFRFGSLNECVDYVTLQFNHILYAVLKDLAGNLSVATIEETPMGADSELDNLPESVRQSQTDFAARETMRVAFNLGVLTLQLI